MLFKVDDSCIGFHTQERRPKLSDDSSMLPTPVSDVLPIATSAMSALVAAIVPVSAISAAPATTMCSIVDLVIGADTEFPETELDRESSASSLASRSVSRAQSRTLSRQQSLLSPNSEAPLAQAPRAGRGARANAVAAPGAPDTAEFHHATIGNVLGDTRSSSTQASTGAVVRLSSVFFPLPHMRRWPIYCFLPFYCHHGVWLYRRDQEPDHRRLKPTVSCLGDR